MSVAAADPLLAQPFRRERRAVNGGAIEIITLDRPAQRNALSEFMLTSLLSVLDELKLDPHVRAIVIAANGPVFCAGHDLKELTARRSDADRGTAYFREIMGLCAQVMQAIVQSPKPVIAAVDGVATAAGCQLVASCDLAVASETAQFCTPGVNIGLFCSTPMVALSRNITRKRALEMLLLGEMLSAENALEFGLVNRVVPAGQALQCALQFADAPELNERMLRQTLGSVGPAGFLLADDSEMYERNQRGVQQRRPSGSTCRAACTASAVTRMAIRSDTSPMK